MQKRRLVTIGAVALAVLGTAWLIIWNPAPSLSSREAAALVRYHIVTSSIPDLDVWEGYYRAVYEGRGKWKVETPLGQWALLESTGAAFPITMTRFLGARFRYVNTDAVLMDIANKLIELRYIKDCIIEVAKYLKEEYRSSLICF